MIDAFQVLILALTLWFEARGEGEPGMRLVADTIYNRSNNNPATMLTVVLKPKQYSCWDYRDPEKADIPLQESPADRLAWSQCIAIAKLLMSGCYEPATTSTHYWERGVEKKAWQYELEIVLEYGNHIFAKKRQ